VQQVATRQQLDIDGRSLRQVAIAAHPSKLDWTAEAPHAGPFAVIDRASGPLESG
jgi:hypothetical protein